MRSPGLAAGAVLTLLMGLSGCGGDGDSGTASAKESADPDAALTAAADLTTCSADASAASLPGAEEFPSAWAFPPATTVFNVEDRAGAGTIVTGVTTTPFTDVLDFLNNDAVAAGFAITEGETEEHDAEANWTSDGFTGRWAIRESSTCPGETVVQVLATPAS